MSNQKKPNQPKFHIQRRQPETFFYFFPDKINVSLDLKGGYMINFTLAIKK
jgi:acyl-CoA hydrolase